MPLFTEIQLFAKQHFNEKFIYKLYTHYFKKGFIKL